MGAVATNLDSPGVEEALKVLPLLDSIIDKNDPDIKGETIGANAVFATVEILAERKKGNIGVVDAIKKHKGPMTVEAFREIAEKLNGT